MSLHIDMTGGGYFFAKSATLGSTDDEIEAIVHGTTTTTRMEEIASNVRAAVFQLGTAQPQGRG